jgi:hypothetical protein
MSNSYPVFIVVSVNNCCQKCANTYIGKVFDSEKDHDKKTPLHKGCTCSTIYFITEKLAKLAAKKIEKERLKNKNATQKQ